MSLEERQREILNRELYVNLPVTCSPDISPDRAKVVPYDPVPNIWPCKLLGDRPTTGDCALTAVICVKPII